jgi:hypothetical protein
MKEYLIQHRNQKRTKATINENKSTQNNDSQVKRLRLRGDWSDTGIFIMKIFSIKYQYFFVRSRFSSIQ